MRSHKRKNTHRQENGWTSSVVIKWNTPRQAKNGSTRRCKMTYPRTLGCISEGEKLLCMHQTLQSSALKSSAASTTFSYITQTLKESCRSLLVMIKKRKIVHAMYAYLYTGWKYNPRSWLAKTFSIVISGKIVEWETLKKFQLSCNNALLSEKMECEYSK